MPISKMFDTPITIHTSMHNYDVSLSQEFLKHLSNEFCKHDVKEDGKQKNGQVKKLDKKRLSYAKNQGVDHKYFK